MALYLIKADNQPIWDHEEYEKNPIAANLFELYDIEEDELEEELREMKCDIANDYYDPEVHEDYGEFVENNSDIICVKYDPNNPTHIEHKGFEDQRPEHVAWLAAEKVRLVTTAREARLERLVELREEQERISLEIERIKEENK